MLARTGIFHERGKWIGPNTGWDTFFVKIQILWSNASGYLASCVNALSQKVDVAICIADNQTSTNFDPSALFSPQVSASVWHPALGERPTMGFHEPDLLLVSGWMYPQYLRLARRFAGRTRRVMAMDNQWTGSFRQRAAQVARWRWIRPYFDAAFVPGWRQRTFAAKLGITSAAIYPGLYSTDPSSFVPSHSTSPKAPFTFVGRLAEIKGLPLLLRTYSQYREEVESPRRLRLVGQGPLFREASRIEGTECLGFVSPNDLSALLPESWAFVLPSVREPWGVAMHEAAASGLPLLVSSSCGASDAFLGSQRNGWLFPPDSPSALLQALNEADSLSLDERREMGNHSRALSLRYTPEKWTQTVVDMANRIPSRWEDVS